MKKDNLLFVVCVIIMWIVWLLFCAKFLFAQQLQRYQLMAPYKGQISAYSDWTIPPDAWNELTNCYVDEQGKLVQRPGFYCWKDSVDTTEAILGAYEYTKQIEGGETAYIITNTKEKIYRTNKNYGTSNTDVSGGLSFSDDGIPVFDVFYNMLFMANGEDNPIMYDQDANVIQIGRTVYSGAIVFEDTNEVTSDTDFTSGSYHFRVGMDLTIADSNNNGTYEIVSVDTNVIVIRNTDTTAVDLQEESDSSVTLTGLGIPDELDISRTETVQTISMDNWFVHSDSGYDSVSIFCLTSLYTAGFRVGMTLTISGSSHNNGTYTIKNLGTYTFYVDGTFTQGYDGNTITFTGTQTITTSNAFNPITIAGHKGRLFAGGVKELPTYLFWTRSKYATQYFYDVWRDRTGYDDGTGYYDLRDKIIALEPDYNGMLVIFCKNSILYLQGDDPGFDILTPNQTFIFQPVPITKEIGIIGPNAKKRIGKEIFFYSQHGLHTLSSVIGGNILETNLISLPVKNLHKIITNDMISNKTIFDFLPYNNLLLMLFRGTYSSTLDDLVLCYNISNSCFSTFEFSASSEPTYLFSGGGFDEDPNVDDIVYKEAEPAKTVWFGSEDGKLFSLHNGFTYDIDYEDPNNSSLNSISMTAITAKLNMGNPFLEKTFLRGVFLCSPQINYDPNSQGQVSLYYKADDNSWSSATNKTFTASTETAGTVIDTYEFLDPGVAFRTEGKTLQLKLTTSGTTSRFGFQFVGAMIEFIPQDYRI